MTERGQRGDGAIEDRALKCSGRVTDAGAHRARSEQTVEQSDGMTVLQIHCLTVLWWGNFEVIVNEDWRMGESEVSLRAVSNRITVGL